jgi:hypothetical protein
MSIISESFDIILKALDVTSVLVSVEIKIKMWVITSGL